ncbi:MAG: type II toxin-antitoxin system Phd/YefM family antitoxin [Candidatus Dormibacter sp.]
MTIMVSVTSQVSKSSAEWPVADAKARFSELIDRALEQGPQIVTRNGRRTVAIVPVDQWERSVKQHGSLAAFFAASPLRASRLKVQRGGDLPRDIDL